MRKLDLPQVERKSLEVKAVETLRRSIISGAIPAGSRVTEIGVSEQIGLSRATVRMAFHQLAVEGLVRLLPYTGWMVVSLSPEDVWELFTLRSTVERLAARLAARAMDERKAARLRIAFDELEARCCAADRVGMAEADFDLHKTIVGMAGHERLRSHYGLIEQQTRILVGSSDALVAEPAGVLAQHEPIVAALLDGKPEEAAHLVENHILVEGEILAAHLRGSGMADTVHPPADTPGPAPRARSRLLNDR